MAKAKRYRHLTCNQRWQISALLESPNFIPQKDIAKIIKSTQSTVSRELKNNSGRRGYCPMQAHKKAVARRRAASSSGTKLTVELEHYIESKLKLQWSPEQISGSMGKACGKRVSHTRIYQYVWADKDNRGTLYKNLRRRGKKYNKQRNKAAGRGHIPNRVCIEERPKIVDAKQRVGDFEVDTIVGLEHRGAILSVVDRATKLTFLVLLPRGTAENVKNAMISALRPIEEHVLTITSDNGKEFAQHQEIASKLCADFYFAHPYCSWERGLNENTNGLVRQYFPKGTDFQMITQAEVNKVQELLNSRPRKALDYMTPSERFFNATGKTISPTFWVNYMASENAITKLIG